FHPADLPKLATALESLGTEYHPEIAGIWQDWGRFRAVPHRLVHQALEM
ncbi:MAG: hypothetical protein H0T53_08640, partial [Herpetosiphonaceae bacterium]|nr:hypothetical protein [Herpetosiphonaceae bacterium]